jgi:hypothetical protein
LLNGEEPVISVRDPTGILLVWIDVGSPSAERLHKAAKAARRVALYTRVDTALSVERRRADPSTGLTIGRTTKLEIVRTDGRLYATVDENVYSPSAEGEAARFTPGQTQRAV